MTEPTTPAKAAGRKVSDAELIAMHDCAEVLAGLDDLGRARVVAWLLTKFAAGLMAPPECPAGRPDPRENGQQ